MSNESAANEARQERREQKLRKKQGKMLQHGKTLAKIYKDAILKRLERKGK